MLSANHGSLVGMSKPTVFTGASAMFLLVYLALWKYHDNSFNGPVTNDVGGAASGVQHVLDVVEEVLSCDPDELVNNQNTIFKIIWFN